MGARRKFSSEYKREAVAMLDVPGVTVSQIAAFCAKRQRSSRERRHEVSDDPAMPRRLSHPIDVPVFTGISQWV